MSLTLSLIKPYSLYENIILAIFSKMEHGSLKLTLPAGEKIQFGNGNGQVEAKEGAAIGGGDMLGYGDGCFQALESVLFG